MSYQQPQDYYTHSNASQFDDRYQQGAYRDENSNYQQYSSGGNGGGSYPQQQQSYGGGYQDASPMNTPYGSRFDLDHQPQQQSHQDASAYKDYAGSDAYYADGAAANAGEFGREQIFGVNGVPCLGRRERERASLMERWKVARSE